MFVTKFSTVGTIFSTLGCACLPRDENRLAQLQQELVDLRSAEHKLNHEAFTVEVPTINQEMDRYSLLHNHI